MSVRLDHGEDTLDEVHEINVTPFIDVMLVLLIPGHKGVSLCSHKSSML
jgi:hypothetical protein